MRPPRQRGVAAVEAALIMAAIIVWAPLMVALGSVYRSYVVLQGGVSVAARYLSALPPAEMKSYDSIDTAVDVARYLVYDSGTDANLASRPGRNATTVLCGGHTCSTFTVLPATVQVQVQFAFVSADVPGWQAMMGGSDLLWFTLDNTVPYGR